MLDLTIKNAKIFRNGKFAREDIGIENGKISEIGSVGLAKTEIDASGKYVFPGLIDPHVHLREPGAEHKAVGTSQVADAVIEKLEQAV